MTAIARPARPPLAGRAWVRTLTRPGPGQWLFVAAAIGWILLIALAVANAGWLGSGTVHHHSMDGHEMPGMPNTGMGASDWSWSTLGWAMTPAMWVAMLAATMLPLIAPNVRFVARRSPRARRTASTLNVVAGWTLVWFVVATLLAVGSWLVVRTIGPIAAIIVTFAVAIGWQLTRRKRVSVARCHRTFAPPLDSSAASACTRFGMRLGADCASSCWAIMAAMAVSNHQLLVLVPLAWVPWFERRRPHFSPGTRTTVIVIAATAVAALIAHLTGGPSA